MPDPGSRAARVRHPDSRAIRQQPAGRPDDPQRHRKRGGTPQAAGAGQGRSFLVSGGSPTLAHRPWPKLRPHPQDDRRPGRPVAHRQHPRRGRAPIGAADRRVMHDLAVTRRDRLGTPVGTTTRRIAGVRALRHNPGINCPGIPSGISEYTTTLSRHLWGSQCPCVSDSRISTPISTQFVTHRCGLSYCPPSHLSRRRRARLSRAFARRPLASSRACPHLAARPRGSGQARACGHGSWG
jgi:hypothetical protein